MVCNTSGRGKLASKLKDVGCAADYDHEGALRAKKYIYFNFFFPPSFTMLIALGWAQGLGVRGTQPEPRVLRLGVFKRSKMRVWQGKKQPVGLAAVELQISMATESWSRHLLVFLQRLPPFSSMSKTKLWFDLILLSPRGIPSGIPDKNNSTSSHHQPPSSSINGMGLYISQN